MLYSNISGKTFVVFVILGMLIWMMINNFIMMESKSGSVDTPCTMEPSKQISPEVTGKNLMLFKEPVAGEENIIFLETKCAGHGIRESSALLNARQACSVEAAARNNPSASVYVLHTCEFNRKNILTGPKYLRLLLTYPNVYLSDLEWQRRFEGTPLEEWLQNQKLAQSSYPMVHISDVVRFLVLWKFGGTYLDLDMVLTRSLHGLSNYAGAQATTKIGNTVLNFAHEGIGHEVATACLEEIKTDFRGNIWDHNGPGAITRVLKKICGVNKVLQMTPEHCHGFKVHHPSVFYPIFFPSWRMYFDEENVDRIMKKFNNSWGIHVWNKLSAGINITVGSRTPYGLVAQEHCPNVYSNCGNIF